ncbi:Expansin [Lachnellula occidentalis]|uniref:Expansin n=1 Tax=Lachnellula occidentalis TaxID=215460 RepID=A0A8H8U8V3_9HELO|nr:Expansin [Lachnellula occidentalis]
MHFSSALAMPVFLTLANAAVLGKRALSGQATTYGGNVVGGACSFSTYTLPSNIFGTALSDSNWDTSANCGACVSVTGPDGNSITAMIVDECPGCGTNHLDLFPTAFTSLASLSTGVIDVAWSYVDCPITSPLQVHLKEGVSEYWFSMQVVNANKAVSKLEVSTDSGSTWQSTTRMDYNFFENSSGFGTASVDVKITSSAGDVVIVNNVAITAGSVVTAASNFGSSTSTAASSSAVVAAVVASSVVSSTTPIAAVSTSVVATPSSVAPSATSVAPVSTPAAIEATSAYSAPTTIVPTASPSTSSTYSSSPTLSFTPKPTYADDDACEW